MVRQSGRIWAPSDHGLTLSDRARINIAAARRVVAQSDVSGHFEHLLRTALEQTHLPAQPLVLDILSGDGARSVIPWLAILPKARIVATDPADMLLATLVSNAAALGHEDRVVGIVAAPEEIVVAPGTFDLVSAVACLHEMDDPDQALALAASALRPGGYAILIAPFDGHGILRIAYERIVEEAPLWPDDPLDPATADALRRLSADIAARTLPDPTEPSFRALDQKWLFAREAIEGAARALGFEDVQFLAHNDHETLYRDVAAIQIRTITGSPDAALPSWAQAVLDSFDRALRPPVKRLLMLDATVVLRR
jgi:SAM-dependent methyltransferase